MKYKLPRSRQERFTRTLSMVRFFFEMCAIGIAPSDCVRPQYCCLVPHWVVITYPQPRSRGFSPPARRPWERGWLILSGGWAFWDVSAVSRQSICPSVLGRLWLRWAWPDTRGQLNAGKSGFDKRGTAGILFWRHAMVSDREARSHSHRLCVAWMSETLPCIENDTLKWKVRSSKWIRSRKEGQDTSWFYPSKVEKN